MEEPNTQNVSKLDDSKVITNLHDTNLTINLRKIFGPPDGHIWFCIDYTQLQLRIFAKCCNDEFLMQSFKEGKDAHDTVAKEIFKVESPTSQERRAAKGINFGIIFGAGARKIESMTGMPGSYSKFKDRFPLVDPYIKQKGKEASTNGFIRTRGGYPLQVEKRLSYKACNIEVQGTEGELVKDAICRVHAYLKDKPLKMIMVVHDELILESKTPMTEKEVKHPKIQKIIIEVQKLMNGAAFDLGVFTTTDVNRTSTVWADCH
jgi:DNA polymerase-1